MYLPSLPLNFRSENLREINGILLTIIRDKITVKIIRITGDPVIEEKIAESEK